MSRVRIGIIGQDGNRISHVMLSASLTCEHVEVVWFAEARTTPEIQSKLYGKLFEYGGMVNVLAGLVHFLRSLVHGSDAHKYGCKALCAASDIPYLEPVNRSINKGLPETMYSNPEVDYVLIVGCDQLINANGLNLAKKMVLNYHYSPLPAYRGKFAVFWQWYNREPFLGYTFHQVDLGVDTGKSLFQGKVDYNPDEPLQTAVDRVIHGSVARLSEMYACVFGGDTLLLDPACETSSYPSKRYLDLLTVQPDRTVSEVMEVLRRVGHLRLVNGIRIRKVTHTGSERPDRCRVERDGIVVPLADGHIKCVPSAGVPFVLLRRLIRPDRLLSGLD